MTCYAILQLSVDVLHEVAVLFFGALSPFPAPLKVWAMATTQKIDLNLYEVAFAAIIAMPLAFAVTAINNYKLLNKAAQKCKISYKFGDENLFSYYLNRDDIRRVWIRDPNVNQTYDGEVISWSETDHIQEIVLANVTVYAYENSEELYWLPSLYLARPTGTFAIEQVEENGESDGQKATQ